MKTEHVIFIVAALGAYFFMKSKDSARLVSCGVYGMTSQEQCNMLQQQDAGLF